MTNDIINANFRNLLMDLQLVLLTVFMFFNSLWIPYYVNEAGIRCKL